MFIIKISYRVPIEEIDKYLIAHRAHLDKGYEENLLVCSGPQIPRDGGILISYAKNRGEIEEFMARDPFSVHALINYDVIEFDPIKYHKDFKSFV